MPNPQPTDPREDEICKCADIGPHHKSDHFLTPKTMSQILDYIDGCTKYPGGKLFKGQRFFVEEYIKLYAAERVREALEDVRRRVIRRTGIPPDARNPTRDLVVITGEVIDPLIATLTHKEKTDERN